MESQYDTVIAEYQREDEDGKTKLVYAYFGLAIYFAQCLEECFAAMLWTDGIFRKKVKTNEEVNEIIDAVENSKKTMGNLIHEVKQIYQLPDDIAISLKDILERRNYLAHKYFKDNIEKFYNDSSRLEMIKYFSLFIDDAQALDFELKKYYSHHLVRIGLTEEKLNEMMSKIIADAKG
jgi:hypothetical protein